MDDNVNENLVKKFLILKHILISGKSGVGKTKLSLKLINRIFENLDKKEIKDIVKDNQINFFCPIIFLNPLIYNYPLDKLKTIFETIDSNIDRTEEKKIIYIENINLIKNFQIINYYIKRFKTKEIYWITTFLNEETNKNYNLFQYNIKPPDKNEILNFSKNYIEEKNIKIDFKEIEDYIETNEVYNFDKIMLFLQTCQFNENLNYNFIKEKIIKIILFSNEYKKDIETIKSIKDYFIVYYNYFNYNNVNKVINEILKDIILNKPFITKEKVIYHDDSNYFTNLNKFHRLKDRIENSSKKNNDIIYNILYELM